MHGEQLWAKPTDIDNSKMINPPSSFTTMAIFASLNPFDNSENRNVSGAEINLIDAQIALSQLISADKEGSEEGPKLGLCDTARITLDIVNAAQVHVAFRLLFCFSMLTSR